MKIKILEENEEMILLEWEDIICPYCNNEKLYVHNFYNDVELSSQKIKKFLKKKFF